MNRLNLQRLVWLVCVALWASSWTMAQEVTGRQNTAGSTGITERAEAMKSRGPKASLTILPVLLVGTPFDRVSEIVGVLLEQQGLENIEIGKDAFSPESGMPLDKLTASFGEFVAKKPVTTEYVLYAEFNGKPRSPLDELRAVVVDSKGCTVWSDRFGDGDVDFKNVRDRDPMTFSVLLANRLAPRMGLNDETRKAAKPGKMARLMEERSGLPPAAERDAIPPRTKIFRDSRNTLTLAVFPPRIGDTTDPGQAAVLAKMITDAGLCRAVPASTSLLLTSSKRDPNELKALWDLAREFRVHARSSPEKADYVLYADYSFNPQQWEQGTVHFVVCDRRGEWTVVDLQNSHHPDYQSVRPVSVKTCDALLIRRLSGYLKLSAADVLRETIQSSGIDAARSKFAEIQQKKDEYLVAEDQINNLGYEYLQAGKIKEAIAVFTLNTEAFSESFNAFDSLGEAYAAAGEKEHAIRNYKKSLELNPQSQSGIEALKKLEAH
jgi:hypothetical protein